MLGETWFTAVAQDDLTEFSVTAVEGVMIIGVFDSEGLFIDAVTSDIGEIVLPTIPGDMYYIGMIASGMESSQSGFVSFNEGLLPVFADLSVEISEVIPTADDDELEIQFTILNLSDVDITTSFDIDFWENLDAPPEVGDISEYWLNWDSDILANSSVDFSIVLPRTRDSGKAFVLIDTFNEVVEDVLNNNVDGLEWEFIELVPDPYEPDDTPEQAHNYIIGVDGLQARSLHVLGDIDFLQSDITASETILIQTSPHESEVFLVDTVVVVFNSTGTILAYDDDSGTGYYSRLIFTPSVTGTYYIAVISYYLWDGGSSLLGEPGGIYNLEIDESESGSIDLDVKSDDSERKELKKETIAGEWARTLFTPIQ